MADTIEQGLSLDIDYEDLDKLVELFKMTPQSIQRSIMSVDQQKKAYNILTTQAKRARKELDNLHKQRAQAIASGNIDLATSLGESIKSKSEEVKNIDTAVNSVAEPGMAKKLYQGMDKLTDGIGELFGISPQVISGATSVVGAVAGVVGPLTAIIAILKTLVSLGKQQIEWDKLNARINAFGGDNSNALNIANELGMKYTQEFAGMYTQLLYRARGSTEEVDRLVRSANDIANATGFNDTMGLLKDASMAYTSGDLSSIASWTGASAWEQQQMGFGNNPMYKYSNSDIGMLNRFIEGSVSGQINSRIVNGKDIQELSNDVRSMNIVAETMNKTTNTFASAMTTSKISGGNLVGKVLGNNDNTTTIAGSSRATPVSVINSIMLSNTTIDALTDLREHQFMTQINLSHTTPMVTQNNTFNNGASIDTNAMLESIGNSIYAKSNNSSTLYNDGQV